jgi:Acyl-protein synthetase, LuxE
MVTDKIFAPNANFESLALEIFAFQYQHCSIYRQYVDAIKCKILSIKSITDIPFLPIQFFKTHRITCNDFVPELIFKSSGTTSTTTSTHFVKHKTIYEHSFRNGIQQFYDTHPSDCIIGLLPSYVENGDSSLVYMVDDWIKKSTNEDSGIYLYDYKKLADVLIKNVTKKIKTILIGVTYALLDFAAQFPMQLDSCITIIETGGMKGRGKELTKQEVHQQLQMAFGLQHIHSEYGMTELLSQAYSIQHEIFVPSHTMQVLGREINDPLATFTIGKGVLNIIDLANVYSCSFIATQDVGEIFADKTFKVNGRLDASDLRGCNMLGI